MASRRGRAGAAAVLGALAGLGLGAAAHGLVAPALEALGGGWEELQGFAWNAVPLGTVAGGVLGWVVGDRRAGRDGDA